MAKQCTICGKKIKFLDQNLSFKDGKVCMECANKVGLTTNFDSISWASAHHISDLKALIDSGQMINPKKDKELAKQKIKAEKLEQKQSKKEQAAAAQQAYVNAKNEFKKPDTEIFGNFYFNPTDKKVFRDRNMDNHDYRVFNFSDITNYQAAVKDHNGSKKHGLISAMLTSEDDTKFDSVDELYVIIQLKDGSSETAWLITTKAGKTISSVAQNNLQKLCSLLDQILAENNIPVASRISYVDTTLNSATQAPIANNGQSEVTPKKPSRKAPHCPRCKSNNIQIIDNKRKFSLMKTAAGGFIFGAPGTAAGALIGKRGKKYHAVCMDCGKKFDIKL